MGSGSFPQAGADERGVWVGWSRRDGRAPVVNAAVVHTTSAHPSVLRVAAGADLGSVLPSPFASLFGGSMLLAYADVGAEPDHLDLSVYPN